MNSAISARLLRLDEAGAFNPQQIVDLARSPFNLSQEVEALKPQVDWFRRQLFGQKSERRIVEGGSGPMSLGELIDPGEAPAPRAPSRPTPGARRRTSPTPVKTASPSSTRRGCRSK